MKTLVLGGTGQIGRHLARLLPDADFWFRDRADFAAPASLETAVKDFAPELIVNAAAYTAVDRAEQEAELAWRVNAEAPAALARAADEIGAGFVHISTDYVFDGASERPYREADAPRPLGVYGRSKLAGELAVETLCTRYWIIRTSWVFSEHGSNFVKTMLRLASDRDRLSVVADQRGRPSYAGDVAALIAALTAGERRGVAPTPGTYHSGGGPVTSWCDFAREIFRLARDQGLIERAPTVVPIATSEYPTPAVRPMSSVLEPSEAFQAALGVAPDWQAGLKRTLTHLRSQQELTHE